MRFSFSFLSALLLASCSLVVDPNGTRNGTVDSGSVDAGSDTSTDRDVPEDTAPMCEAGCDDGVACTTDVCEGGECRHTPSDAACGEGFCDPARGCVLEGCSGDAMCDDGDACNGAERCDEMSGRCVAGDALVCDDGVDCTLDRCVDGGCVFEQNNAACEDDVECTTGICTPRGCEQMLEDRLCESDCGPARCTREGCVPRGMADRDGDGFFDIPMGCGFEPDCDDRDPLIYPGAEERCNGVDDDCDGEPEPRCEWGASCSFCGGAITGRMNCFSACGTCEVADINISPQDPRYTHECGSTCGGAFDNWCVDSEENCFAISSGPLQIVPPGRHEFLIDLTFRDRSEVNVAVFDAAGGFIAEGSLDGRFGLQTLRVDFEVDTCMEVQIVLDGRGTFDIRGTRIRVGG